MVRANVESQEEDEVELTQRVRRPQWMLDATLGPASTEPPASGLIATTLKPLHYPVATVLLLLGIWSAFLYGKIFMRPLTGFGTAGESISPPNPRLFFMTVNFYPDCSDKRLQLWRLLTVQLVHSGWTHITGNTLLGLMVGALLEGYSGWMFAAATFEAAVVVGSLAHSFVLPYHALIGCSHGVYGWYGALLCYCLSHLRQGPGNAFVVIAVAATISYDGYRYAWHYQPEIAYEAHFGGFLAGFLVCCIAHCGWRKSTQGFVAVSTFDGGATVATLTPAGLLPESPVSVASRCGVCCLFVGLVMYLAVHVGTSWPPAPPFNPTLHALPAGSCCAALFRLAPPGGNLTRSYVTDNYRCGAGYNLQPPG
jgi:membrane associated rhomboid family serine protease